MSELKISTNFVNSKVEVNSIRTMDFKSSILTWFRMSIGIGLFQLPYIYSKVGIIQGTIFVLISSILNYFSCICLFELSIKLKLDDYEKIVKHYLNNYLTKIFNLFLVLDIGSLLMLNPVVAWNQLHYLIRLVGLKFLVEEDDSKYIDNNFITKTIFIIISIIVLFPFFLKKRLSNFNFFNKTYLIIVLLIIITLIIEFPFMIYSKYQKYTEYPVSINKNINKNTFIYLTNFSLSFYIQPLLFDLKKEIVDQSLSNLKKVSFWSILLQTILYIFIGIVGYISIGDNSSVHLINNRAGLIKSDFYMAIFNFIFGLLMMIGIPLFNITMRNFCYSLFNKTETERNFKYFSVLPPLICLILSNIFPNIIEIFSLCGSIICNFNGYFLIFLIYIRLKTPKKLYGVWIMYIFVSFLMFYYILAKIFFN